MQEQRIEFAQGHEDEPALVHSRVWHHEIRFIDNPLAIEQNVQIDGPGGLILSSSSRPRERSISRMMARRLCGVISVSICTTPFKNHPSPGWA